MHKTQLYKSYLLRLWWKEGTDLCRIGLEEVKEQAPIVYFTDITHFVEFLVRPPTVSAENNSEGENQP